MDRVPVEVWLIGGVAVLMVVVRVQLGIERRRSAEHEQGFQHWLSYLTVGLVLAGAGTGWITSGLDRPVLLSWLAAINVVAIAFYGWDKLAASLAVARVPERTLHLLALAGGSVGAFLAQSMFHHKTRKTGFQLRFWSVVVLQVALLAVYFRTQSSST